MYLTCVSSKLCEFIHKCKCQKLIFWLIDLIILVVKVWINDLDTCIRAHQDRVRVHPGWLLQIHDRSQVLFDFNFRIGVCWLV